MKQKNIKHITSHIFAHKILNTKSVKKTK